MKKVFLKVVLPLLILFTESFTIGIAPTISAKIKAMEMTLCGIPAHDAFHSACVAFWGIMTMLFIGASSGLFELAFGTPAGKKDK